MILNELYSRNPSGYQNIEDDNSRPTVNNLRKTRLTLRQIHKLRQLNDIRTIEYAEKIKDIQAQYAPPQAPPGL